MVFTTVRMLGFVLKFCVIPNSHRPRQTSQLLRMLRVRQCELSLAQSE